MQDPKTITINGQDYVFSYLRPSAALKLLVTLKKIMLTPLGALVDGAKGQAGKLDMDADISVAAACEALSNNMDADQVVEIVKTLLGTVMLKPGELAKKRGRVDLDLDLDFAGELKLLFKIVYQALEVNYGDFFADLKGLLSKAGTLMAKMKASIPGQAPSPGQSGG